MDTKTKKIIAREGLVFAAFLVGSFITAGLISLLASPEISALGACVIYVGYPIYLLIRFIIWAVKTLK